MFTSDSQHPPRSKHAVYLGDGVAEHKSFSQNQISLLKLIYFPVDQSQWSESVN